MKIRPNVGLTDVAHAAGVSVSTASRALRGEERVSPDTVALVRATAERLGYVPDKRAVNLRSHTPAAVGLVLRSAELSFYGAIAAQMQAAVDANGIDLLIANGGDDHTSQLRAIETLVGHRVAGIVFASGRASSEAISKAAASVPTVLVGAVSATDGIDSVVISSNSEMQVARAVLEAGHRRVAITRSLVSGTAVLQRRSERYEETLLADRAAVTVLDVGDGLAGLRSQIDLALEHSVTAIMAGDDLTALHILEILAERDIRCPEDISVTGFDGVGVLQSPLLGLTTMKQPVEDLAATATALILGRIAGSSDDAARSEIPGQFVPGRTLRQLT